MLTTASGNLKKHTVSQKPHHQLKYTLYQIFSENNEWEKIFLAVKKFCLNGVKKTTKHCLKQKIRVNYTNENSTLEFI